MANNTQRAILQAILRRPKLFVPEPLKALDVPLAPNRHDKRPDGSLKGSGYFGALKRADGGVSSEISMSFSDVLGGRDIPLLVPTLTPDEVAALLRADPADSVSQSIIDKAISFAKQRVKAGKPVFAEDMDRDVTRYPQFARVPTLKADK